MGINEDINSIELERYRNKTEVVSGRTLSDVSLAGLIARLNMGYLGATGEGKTQLENDTLGIFGNKGYFEQGRNDLTVKETLARLNFNEITEKQEIKKQVKYAWNPETGQIECFVPVYKKGRFTYASLPEAVKAFQEFSSIKPEMLFEVTNKTRYSCYVIDEILRCIPSVQNQFFNFFDGFFTYQGMVIPLGCEYLSVTGLDGTEKIINGPIPEEELKKFGGYVSSGRYSIGICSANSGKEYVGSSDADRALLDRVPLLIDVDYFYKQPEDTLEILASKDDPRVTRSTQPKDQTETIIRLHNEFKKRKTTVMQKIAVLYLVHGLDHYTDSGGTERSKRKDKRIWPGSVGNHDSGSDAALIMPFSTRAGIAVLSLAKALGMVSEAKETGDSKSIENVFDAAYLIGAQSGILHPAAVVNNYKSNPYEAMKAVVDGIRSEFMARTEVIGDAFKSASKGELKHLEEFTGRWGFMKGVLCAIAKEHTPEV